MTFERSSTENLDYLALHDLARLLCNGNASEYAPQFYLHGKECEKNVSIGDSFLKNIPIYFKQKIGGKKTEK